MIFLTINLKVDVCPQSILIHPQELGFILTLSDRVKRVNGVVLFGLNKESSLRR